MSETWHILGAGAIGSLFACKLSRAGLACELIIRADEGGSRYIRLRENGGSQGLAVPARAIDALAPDTVHRVLLTTKANQAADAYRSLRPALAEGAVVVLLTNGMGVADALLGKGECDDITLALGTTTEGAYFDADRSLVHAGVGETHIGEPGGEQSADWFNDLDLPAERIYWAGDIEANLWRKLTVNCAINPLTAVHGCNNGALLEDDTLRGILHTLCVELAAVGEARGFTESAQDIETRAVSVARATAANRSSMLQDVSQGRPTEIEYITGYLCAEADRLGVPCPANSALLEAVRQLRSNLQ